MIQKSGKTTPTNKVLMASLGMPFSFDPLMADKSENILIARLIYTTPFEITKDDNLVSKVLEDYQYSPGDFTLKLKVKQGVKYSNGELVEPKDIVLSILRLAQGRPNFPLIKDILGMAEWRQKKESLVLYPSGVSIKNNTIQIRFKKNVTNPFFRLTMEVYSIIPSSAVDLESGLLKTPTPPTSGYYTISKIEKDNIFLTLRESPQSIHNFEAPKNIAYHVSDFHDFPERAKELSDAIILGKTAMVGKLGQQTRENLDIRSLPTSMFHSYHLNQKIPPFDKTECRQQFSDILYQEFKKIVSPDTILSRSLFTSITPGYIDDGTLISSRTQKNTCDWKNTTIKWCMAKNDNSNFTQAFLNTLKRLEVKNSDPKIVPNWANTTEEYYKNNNSILHTFSGFWAQDPVGDVNMYFSLGFHRSSQVIANDPKVISFLEQLSNSTPGLERKKMLEGFNEYIFEEALLNVYMHTSKMVAVPKGVSSRVDSMPMAISTPAIWQILTP